MPRKSAPSTELVLSRFALILLMLTWFAVALFHGFQKPHSQRAVERASNSIVFINMAGQNGTSSCSGEVIAQDRVLTARHCLGDKMWADGQPATVQSADDFYDLALLNVKTSRPFIRFRTTPVSRFEDVTGIGYAFGWDQLVAVSAHVVLQNIIPFPKSAPGIILQTEFIGGMSGGPVVDASGAMVTIVQQGSMGLSHGVNIAEIQVFLLTTDTHP